MSITPDSVLLSKLLFDVVKDRQAKTGRQGPASGMNYVATAGVVHPRITCTACEFFRLLDRALGGA
ncbi:hypothetical protein [Paraburkholderia phenoliruptrix]|uniref:hypothetical protein n=1 Tax=Paraburkholderia phenoliruptrix TaxID=252970 RepID=UPI0034CE85A1